MTVLASLPATDWAVGTRSFSTGNIASNYSKITLILSRESWPQDPATVVLTASVEYSSDGGDTWSFIVGCTTGGGTIVGLPNTTISTVIPDVGSSTRRLRGNMTNNFALRSALTLDAEV